MNKYSRIFIVGHSDSVENSLLNYFMKHGFCHVFSSTKNKLDVLDQAKVRKFFKSNRPEYVFLGSVRSGGIQANQKFAAEFIYENLESQNNVIHAAYEGGVKKLIYLTGSCTYPKECRQPMKEEYLLTGELEATSEPYSIAKIAGTKLCQTYRRQYGFDAIVLVPATLYGPGSDTDMQTAHVLGALISKFHKAVVNRDKEIVLWGSGKPRREFLYVDDFVDAALFALEHYNDIEMLNVGAGGDVTIKQLAQIIKKISGFKGKIVFDSSKPDGTMRKLMDNSRVRKLGWKPKVGLEEGIRRTYQWYKN